MLKWIKWKYRIWNEGIPLKIRVTITDEQSGGVVWDGLIMCRGD